MNSIRIINELSNSCLLAESLGDRLFELLQKELETHETIELDFAGYKYVSKEFFLQSFGRLCQINGLDAGTFERKIKIAGMEEDDREELEILLNDLRLKNLVVKER